MDRGILSYVLTLLRIKVKNFRDTVKQKVYGTVIVKFVGTKSFVRKRKKLQIYLYSSLPPFSIFHFLSMRADTGYIMVRFRYVISHVRFVPSLVPNHSKSILIISQKAMKVVRYYQNLLPLKRIEYFVTVVKEI